MFNYDSVTNCDKSGAHSQCRMSDGCSQYSGCSINERSWGLENYPLAMVYSPLQKFEKLYDTETALCNGTIFEELDLPFNGASVYNASKGGFCRG